MAPWIVAQRLVTKRRPRQASALQGAGIPYTSAVAIAELNEAHSGLDLQVRVGINTGEAVVALGARPEQGEGIVTGDVVNTASRLQGAAPVAAVVVGEHTYRATEQSFDYQAMEPVA